MSLSLTMGDYADYLVRVYHCIHQQRDYITALDAATGDGDHWVNMDSGFAEIAKLVPSLQKQTLVAGFQKIAETMLAKIGGSGGALYGSAYLQAAKAAADMTSIDTTGLCRLLRAMLEGIMRRGGGQPGMKTMIDALWPAVERYEAGLIAGEPERALFYAVRQAAIDGAESTKGMEAVRGRACYQADHGRGHLDPGAVTMAYQLTALMDFACERLQM